MTDVILQCTGIVKEFPGLRALDEVAFELQLGEVHALVGQNGAGKSTLVKILTGVYTLDAGKIVLEGEPIEIRSPTDAEAHGIAIVHQDQHLVPQFDVTRNVFLGRELTTAGGLLDFDAMRKATTASLERIGADFSPDHLANDLSVGQREQVAIAAALLQEPRVLILDEPTASLSEREIDRLFEVIENLRNSGVSIIYISHHLNEVFRISSRITVLRDGMVAGQLNTRDTDRESIVRLTVGRDLKSLYPKEPVEAGDELLAVENISDGHRFEGVSFRVRRGEIYGLAGLVGAGRTEIALSIMGAGRLRGGSVKLSGKPVHNASPARARDHGFALIPEDRRGEGLIGPLSIRKNMAIPNLSWWSNLGLMSLRKEAERVTQLMARLSIAATSSEQAAETLSGGNQQKVVIGKWLDGQSEVFLFDEPTTGVDVGAKVEIYKEMIELARAGAAVVFISSDLEELVGMCDRVGVVAKGRLEKEIPREDLDLQTLLFWTTAGTRASGPTAAGQAADPGSGTDATPQKAVA
ncbi:MAG: sugar ABC transporter ATP-binding protein, partial [Gammaproteobacteria bacterium]